MAIYFTITNEQYAKKFKFDRKSKRDEEFVFDFDDFLN